MDRHSSKSVSFSHNQDNEFNNSNQQVQTTVLTKVEGVDDKTVIATHQLEVNPIETNRRFFQRVIQFLRLRYGLVLAAIAPIAFSFQSLFVDILTETLDSFQVVLIHVPLYVICCFLLLMYARVRPPKDYKHYLWLFGSGASQSGSTCFLVLAIANLPVGDAVSIFFTNTVQVVFYSRIILKEPIRLSDLLCAFVALGGVVIIARPPFIFGTSNDNSDNDFPLQGIIFALAGSCASAMMLVANRKLSILGLNSYFCMFSNGAVVCFVSGLISLILQRWHWPTTYEWLFVVLAGFSYTCGSFTIFYALKVETATLVTVIVTTEIVYAFVWQIVFLHQLPFWTSYIGTVLVIVACAGTTLKSKLPPSTSSPGLDSSNVTPSVQSSNV